MPEVRLRETMPTDACQFYYECTGCGTLVRPNFNNRRLLEPIGNVPPAEFEDTYHQSTSQLPMAA